MPVNQMPGLQYFTLLAALLLISAFLFTAIQIQTSREIGRLSTVTNYDDVVYLEMASRAYFIGQEDGLLSAAKWLTSQNLHAPFSVLNALLGYLVFGYDTDRVYYANTVVVFLYLLLLGLFFLRLPALLQVGMFAFFLGFPFATMCALEFRPDMAWAIVISSCSVLFLTSSHPFRGWKRSFFFGLSIGAALLIKPSTFAMTLLVMGLAWGLAVLVQIVSAKIKWKQVFLSSAITICGIIIISGPYFVLHGKDIFLYFWEASFGANKDVWIYQGNLIYRLAYYFHGWALDSNLGLFFLPVMIIILIGIVFDIFYSKFFECRIRAVSLAILLSLITIVNGLFSMKSPFLGGSFYGLLIFSCAWYLSRAFTFLSRHQLRSVSLRLSAIILIIGVTVILHTFPSYCRVDPVRSADQKKLNNEVLSSLLEKFPGNRAVLVTTQGGPIVQEYLIMEARSRGKTLQVHSLAFMQTIAPVIRVAKNSNFILLQDKKISGSPGDLIPGERLQVALLNHFSNDRDWALAGKFTASDAKNIYLFEHMRK